MGLHVMLNCRASSFMLLLFLEPRIIKKHCIMTTTENGLSYVIMKLDGRG